MERALKIYSLILRIAVIAGCWLVLMANHSTAQNFSGTVSPEPTPASATIPADSENSTIVKNDQVLIDQMLPNFSEVEESLTDFTQYTLGKDDVIEINVLRHPEVSGSYIINSEGKIQYEFVGDIKVEGLKKDEIAQLLVELLSEYIISPEVTVKITGYNSKIVYVIGEVGRPGKIFMRGDTISVREALMDAGLPLLSAAAKKSKLFTPSDDGDTNLKNVNVYSLLYEGDLRENLIMEPGDTLYIPPTALTKTMRVLNPITQPIGAAATTGRHVTTGF